MKIETKYFGTIHVDEKTLLLFPNGIFGFEQEKRFVLLPFAKEEDFLLCLQSVETPSLAFTALNPFMLMPTYQPKLTESELRQMQVEKSEDLCYYTLCRVNKPVWKSTVNLRCPIVLNDQTRQACQVILDEYEMQCPLESIGRQGGAQC